MRKALVVVEKELQELVLQRGLMLGIAALPLLISVGAVVLLYVIGRVPAAGGALPPQVAADPAFSGMSEIEIIQTLGAKQLSVLLLLMPLFIPSVISSYSVVGEKTARTLEPLLATPIRTTHLLAGKSLTALIPAALVTGLAAAIFIGGLAIVAASGRVFAAVVTPGWLIVLLLAAPALALISVTLTIIVSSRVNDPRTAQQISGVLVVPVMALLFAQLGGVVLLGPAVALAISAVLIVVGLASVWVAARLFEREAILTRWR